MNGLNGLNILNGSFLGNRDLGCQKIIFGLDLICHGRMVRCEPSNGRKGWAPVKIEYDTALDLLNLEFLTAVPMHDSLEVDGVVIDYAKDSGSWPLRF